MLFKEGMGLLLVEELCCFVFVIGVMCCWGRVFGIILFFFIVRFLCKFGVLVFFLLIEFCCKVVGFVEL